MTVSTQTLGKPALQAETREGLEDGVARDRRSLITGAMDLVYAHPGKELLRLLARPYDREVAARAYWWRSPTRWREQEVTGIWCRHVHVRSQGPRHQLRSLACDQHFFWSSSTPPSTISSQNSTLAARLLPRRVDFTSRSMVLHALPPDRRTRRCAHRRQHRRGLP